MLYLDYSCPRSWLFDADLVHELALVVFFFFFVIRHLSLLSYGWFSPLALVYGDSVRGYTYILLIFACCKSVLVSKVTHRLVGW
jgi:hypothetical protein